MLSRTLTTKTLPFIFNVVDLIAVNPCQPPLKALFSTHIVGDKPVLVRDFIHSALYHPKHGYFSQRSRSVGVLDAAIKFNQLQGRKAYMKHVDKIYKQSEISWFTPVELFKIYEIGGGSGTCAKGVMDYIMLNAPERVYNNMTYISVEISPSLAEIQKETVGQVSSHSSKFRVECRDAADRAGWEILQSLNMQKLLEVLHDALPKMSLIASDFTFLPDVKKDGSSTDYGNYLDAKGDADIFFPTDFLLLERMDHYCSGWLKMQKDKSSKQGKKRRTLTLDTSSFMEEFGLPTKTRTKDGYNPLLDDFKNTKFYLSVPTHNTK
ncbi:protein arginine methyltransferase NDUFAF7 [Citrus sinensis]|uniref:Protein arginine methyltransferase NDUFAF7 n=1 Tax=Citrus sinensis TaxID=2711 RepID=A0ACB8I1D3_CITSI|nr:protein arginine methyltransferase NDUFAF7 [Citrus sinensis]